MKENFYTKSARVLTALALVAEGCATVVKPKEQTAFPTRTSTPTLTETPSPTFTSTPKIDTPTPTITPTPENIGIPFTGYWLDITKTGTGLISWKMELRFQEGTSSEVVATFCVRGSDNNTPNGVYFILTDRGTTYPHAPGYANTYFSHNYAFKFARESWYLHPAPWNDKGVGGCPVKSSGGCVNMRPGDFDIIINGGAYFDPVKNEIVQIPHLGVGTPVVITDSGNACKYLGDCMKRLGCSSGLDCFKKFSCEYCVDKLPRWENLVSIKPELSELDIP